MKPNCLLKFSKSLSLYSNGLIDMVSLFAAFFINLSAKNLIFFFTEFFLNKKSELPNLSKITPLSSKPYRDIKFKFSIGSNSLSLFLYINLTNSLI